MVCPTVSFLFRKLLAKNIFPGQALREIPEAKAVETAPFAPIKKPVFSKERTKEAVAESVRPEWSG